MSRPNLYELLKQAGTKPSAPKNEAALVEAPAAVKTLTPPPVKVAAVPLAEPFVPPPLKSTPPKPAPKPSAGLGERVLRVSYNAAAFAGLVVLGLIFLSYAIGVRAGRAPSAQAAATPAPVQQVDPVPPASFYTIRLMEWPYKTAQEQTKARAEAAKLKTSLDDSQFKEGELKAIGDKFVLNYGKFPDPNSNDVKTKLAAMKEFRTKRGQPPAFPQPGLVRAD